MTDADAKDHKTAGTPPATTAPEASTTPRARKTAASNGKPVIQPLKVRRRSQPAPEREPLPLVHMALLLGLATVLADMSWMRLQQGFLTGESALAALRLLLRFGVLPLFLFIVIWRAANREPRSQIG